PPPRPPPFPYTTLFRSRPWGPTPTGARWRFSARRSQIRIERPQRAFSRRCAPREKHSSSSRFATPMSTRGDSAATRCRPTSNKPWMRWRRSRCASRPNWKRAIPFPSKNIWRITSVNADRCQGSARLGAGNLAAGAAQHGHQPALLDVKALRLVYHPLVVAAPTQHQPLGALAGTRLSERNDITHIATLRSAVYHPMTHARDDHAHPQAPSVVDR